MASTVTWARVTGAQTDTAAGQRISPFAAGAVLPIAAVTAVLHCIALQAHSVTATGSTRCTCWPSAAITSIGISRSAALRDYRFIGVAFVALYVVFVATAGRPYYLAGLYALGGGRRARAAAAPRNRPELAVLADMAGLRAERGIGRRRADPVGVDRALRRRRRHARVFADGTTAVVGRDVAAAAHLDGVLNRLRCAARLVEQVLVSAASRRSTSDGVFHE